MNLTELQIAFQDALLSKELSAADLMGISNDSNFIERISIYRDAYYLRLVGNLKTKFESLQKYLGVPEFNRLAVAYLQAKPSDHYSIHRLGASLPNFVREFYPQHLISAELAEFEWTLTSVLFAEEANALSLVKLREQEAEHWPRLVFKFHPSAQIYKAQHSIAALWSALQADQSIESIVNDTSANQLYSYLIWRKQQHSYFVALDSNERKLADCIRVESDFTLVCETMSEFIAEDAVISWVSQRLQAWIEHELLIL